MNFVTGAAILWMAGEYAYHRWFEAKDYPDPDPEVKLPRSNEGASIPIIYGKYKVEKPFLAWIGNVGSNINPCIDNPSDLDGQTYWQGSPFLYHCTLFYNIAIPFQNHPSNPLGMNNIHTIYAGDRALPDGPYAMWPGLYVRLSNLVGDGNFEHDTRPCFVWAHEDIADGQGSTWEIGGLVEFLNGNPNQQLVDNLYPHDPTTTVGERMITSGIPAESIPGYRGYLSMFLGNVGGGTGVPDQGLNWGIGSNPTLQNYSFEVSSYHNYFNFNKCGIGGDEANPAHVIYDILTSYIGKLGIPEANLDMLSFNEAARTLYYEGHGYSISIEDGKSAEDDILDVLKHIDGTLYEDPVTSKIGLKLIRADYDPDLILHITENNCKEIENYSLSSWSGTYNKIKIIFPERGRNYEDGTVTAQNPNNAVGQDGQEKELRLSFRGCCTSTEARIIAARELAARSRPIMRCSAVVNREAYRAKVGDPVAVDWPTLNLSGTIFRIARISKGVVDRGEIKLDLMQETFYVYRNRVSTGGVAGSHPTVAIG